MAEQLLADVLVEVPGWGVDRTFQYRVPPGLTKTLQLGHRVLVPFGNRRVTGFVVGFQDKMQVDRIKDIEGLWDNAPLFGTDELDLAQWMADYYFSPTVKALQTVIAPALKKTAPRRESFYYTGFDGAAWEDLRRDLKNRAPKSLAVLETARANPGLGRGQLASAASASLSVVDSLVRKGLLQVESKTILRNPFPANQAAVAPGFKLTLEQEKAVDQIKSGLNAGSHQVYLLHGVTGSGKTEVYLRSIEQVIRTGRGAISLVPEIALTPQMIKAYRACFGEQVAVLHSRMSDGERFDQWTRIKNGEARVVLGARSAVLAPVPDLGLLIVDEEHEWSYKQDETPRYHARAVALYRAHRHGAVLILGSATPSLETYSRALPGGIYQLLGMKKRIHQRAMPEVRVVDMRQEVRAGNGGIFARLLLEQLRERIKNREQAIIFLNRRGLNTLVVCRECGLVLKCPRCEISLTYHVDRRLRCHYCNYTTGVLKNCPDCQSREVGYFGVGTQKVEKELHDLLPGAKILRMDADTTTRKGSHQQILGAFARGEADILVGTQMIAKGLDLPGVTLVGVINADLTLHMPDFRAGERTFQLLAQVAGRAGRGDIPGEVLIQTYTPHHYAVQTAANHDYAGFYRREMAIRKSMGYPPFAKMIRLLVAGKDETAVQKTAADFRAQLDQSMATVDQVRLLGPAPAPLARLKEFFRWHIIIWSADYVLLRRLMKQFWQHTRHVNLDQGVRFTIDVDPMSMM